MVGFLNYMIHILLFNIIGTKPKSINQSVSKPINQSTALSNWQHVHQHSNLIVYLRIKVKTKKEISKTNFIRKKK